MITGKIIQRGSIVISRNATKEAKKERIQLGAAGNGWAKMPARPE